jgi:hypothetical protein
MRKQQFKKAVRDKLRQVPLEIRKTWNETNLFVWWTAARAADSYLTWERAPGDHVWQHVKVMCGELIGRDAAF